MSADVSVVIPHFNALETIGRSIESVITQTLAVREIIIVDDCSADSAGLTRLVEQYSARIVIRCVLLKCNSGAAHARNTGVSLAQSKYIAFLDSDDIWHPRKIELQYALMREGNLTMSGHGYMFDLTTDTFAQTPVVGSRLISRLRFSYGNPLFTPTVMVLASTFRRFDERFRRMEDYKCWFENHEPERCAMLNASLAGGYKPPLGASGLSASVRLMHQDYVRVLNALFAERKMPPIYFALAIVIEYLKYPIRVCRVAATKAAA